VDMATGMQEIIGNSPLVSRLPFVTKEALCDAQNFQARSDDIFLSTFPKTGTTWMQQICHQLRTGGHTDFDEISEERITPWLEVAGSLGIDLTLDHIAAPRVFKTHQPLSHMSHMPARFICVLRDPEATLVSFFKFMISKDAAFTDDVNEFAKQARWVEGGIADGPPPSRFSTFGAYIWQFYTEFWQCHELPNVHVVSYEAMRKDLRALLPGIATFMGLGEPSEELCDTVMKLSSFDYMKEHEVQFDDHYFTTRMEKLHGTGEASKPEGHVTSSKVGLEVGPGINAKVSDETRKLLETTWQKHVTPITGHSSYAEMEASLQLP